MRTHVHLLRALPAVKRNIEKRAEAKDLRSSPSQAIRRDVLGTGRREYGYGGYAMTAAGARSRTRHHRPF